MIFRHAAKCRRQAHETDIAVGARIRDFRIQAGMSQTTLSEPLALTFQQLQKYENGSNRVSAGRLVQIAAALDRPVAVFFGPMPAATPNDTGDRETLEMVRAFQALPNRALRDAVRHTTAILAKAAVKTA